MNKKWEVCKENKNDIDKISKENGLSNLYSSILASRGIIEKEDVREFLNPTRDDFHAPFLMPDMEKAVDRILKAIQTQEKTIIYGDYDVDGITSITVLKKFLEERNLQVGEYIPNRLNEGYGLNKEAVKKLLGMLKGYRKIIALIIACLLISTGLNMCIPLLSRGIMDYGFIGGDKELLIKQVIGSLLIYMMIAVIDIIKEKKRVDISANIQYSLSEQSFQRLMRIKANYFSSKNYAEILNNINIDIGNMTSVADEGVFFVVTQAFSMVGGIIGLFILDYRMTLMVLLFIPVKAVIMKHFAKKRKRIMDEFITESEKYAGWFGDTVGGVREVKLFGIQENKRAEFADRQLSVINKQKKMNMLAQWNGITDNIIVHLLTSLIYIIGANLVFDMQLSVGSVFAFITYSAYVTGPISAILNIGYLLSGIIPSTKRYYEFMALEEEKENEEGMTEPSSVIWNYRIFLFHMKRIKRYCPILILLFQREVKRC